MAIQVPLIESARTVAKWRSLSRLNKSYDKALSKWFVLQGVELEKRTRKYKGIVDDHAAVVAAAKESGEYDKGIFLGWDKINQNALTLNESIGLDALAKEMGFVAADTFDLLAPVAQAAAAAGLEIGASQTSASFGTKISFELDNPAAVSYLDQYSAQLITKINTTTQNQLNTLITKSRLDGWSYDKLAREINNKFVGFGAKKPQGHIDTRAHLIAITETGQAYEAASLETVIDLDSAGVPMVKFWQTVGDGKVSDGCAENEADGWININKAHSADNKQHPLRFPGCRCTELYQPKSALEDQEPEFAPPPPPPPARAPAVPLGQAKRLLTEFGDDFDKATLTLKTDIEFIVNNHNKQALLDVYPTRRIAITKLGELKKDLKVIESKFIKDVANVLAVENPITVKIPRRPAYRGELKEDWELGFGTFTKIVDESAAPNGINLKFLTTQSSRAGYNPIGNVVNLNKYNDVAAVIHEMGHGLEMQTDSILDMATDFLDFRTEGENEQLLRHLTGDMSYRSESAKPDKFIHPYMGKSYTFTVGGVKKIQSTEIISMGIQMMATNPHELLTMDPEFFDFIFTIIRGGTWERP